MKIYWSPSLEIGIVAIALFWLGFSIWENLSAVPTRKRFFIISGLGIGGFLLYCIVHINVIVKIEGWGADSPIMQLMESFILFSIVYILLMLTRIKAKKSYKPTAILVTVAIIAWTVNAILFNSGLPPYDYLK